MNIHETIKKFLKKSSLLEKIALDLYESIPYHVRNRMLLGPAFIHWTMLLKQAEGWDRAAFREYQFEQIKSLLVHAGGNVPHYRRTFAEYGFHADRMKDFDDFRKVPFLIREQVRDEPAMMVDERCPPSTLIMSPTSGSSGVPLTIYHDKASKAAFLAFRRSILERADYVPGAREIMFWPMVSLGKQLSLPYVRYGSKLIFSIRNLTPFWLRRFVRMTADFNPEFILGFPSVLSVVSSFIKHESPAIFPRLRSVICYAENIYGWQRTLMEEAFGVRVFSMYAMTECPVIGGECEQTHNMHLHPLYGYTEFADSADGYKEIVATGFAAKCMPFVRYLTGDMVTESSDFCPSCGRYHKVVGSLHGRINDLLIGKSGEIIPRLMPWIKTFPNVRQFQFYQEEPGKAYLFISRGGRYSDRDTEEIRFWIDNMLGIMKDSMCINMEFVDDIPLSPAGKAVMVLQKLDVRSFLKT